MIVAKGAATMIYNNFDVLVRTAGRRPPQALRSSARWNTRESNSWHCGSEVAHFAAASVSDFYFGVAVETREKSS